MIFTFTVTSRVTKTSFSAAINIISNNKQKAQAAKFENSWSSIVTLLLDMITRH